MQSLGEGRYLMEIKPFEKISIVGAGTMGAQIGSQCAIQGYPVQIFSRSEKTLLQAAQSHSSELEKRLDDRQLTSDEKETITSRIQFNTNLKQVVSEADLVIENGTRKQLRGYTAYNIVTLNNPGALI